MLHFLRVALLDLEALFEVLSGTNAGDYFVDLLFELVTPSIPPINLLDNLTYSLGMLGLLLTKSIQGSEGE